MHLSLTRVMLFVKDPAALKDFYQKHFNAALLEEINNEWVVLKAGIAELALHKAGANDNPPGYKNNVKLVFTVDANLPAFREQLVRSGVTMKEIKSFGNPPGLFCDGEDIEGNVFQVMQC